jgi:prophage tail gpP-like protein
MPDLQLLIGGTLYDGWKEVSVRRSLDEAADTFDLTLTDRWSEMMARRPLRLGEPCQVLIDGQKLITGYVDRITPRYDARSRSLTVCGRSKVADLVDCSEFTGDVQYNNLTLNKIAEIVCRPFGVRVVSEIITAAIRVATANKGETVFEFLERYARTQAVRLTSNPDGDLVISRAANRRLTTALKLGENILEGSGEFSQRDRFSHYYFLGQHGGWDDDNGETAAHVVGRTADTAVRYRPTTILTEGAVNTAEAQRRAEWQRNVAYGRSRQVTYTVTGWTHAEGLWEPNWLVQVFDEWMGFDGEWLMIGGVEFVMGARGKRALLTVMPKQAYDLIPLPLDDDDAGGTW